MTDATLPAKPGLRPMAERAPRYILPAALVAVVAAFGWSSPTFLEPVNILNVLVNDVALLAIVALGMTLVVTAGGIDLSVGTAIDIASMVFMQTIAAHHGLAFGLLAGILAGAAVGAFNAVLVVTLRITPFLATLGTSFIGVSVQQLSTDGGQPLYLLTSDAAASFQFIGHGRVLGVPLVLILAGLAVATVHVVLSRTTFGRSIIALGVKPGVARYSGLRVPRQTAAVYIASALFSGIAGIVLSSTVKSYVPLSGNAFVLDAIAAAFIGTTLGRHGRPSALGTLLGVILLAAVKNGLLLVGWNFYWQQVGTGTVIFLVLAASFSGRRLRGAGN